MAKSRGRKVGESAVGLLLLLKVVCFGLLVTLLVVAGAWTSWSDGKDAMLSGRERGTMTISSCGEAKCTGTFVPNGSGSVRPKVTIDKAVTRKVGQKLDVAVKPGTTTVVRTGLGGILHAWLPFAGALFLASLIVAGGLGLRRTAWGVGVLGFAVLLSAFIAR